MFDCGGMLIDKFGEIVSYYGGATWPRQSPPWPNVLCSTPDYWFCTQSS